MELRNADGGRAETSGNGLRCFALAAVEAGLVAGPELAIETDSGLRRAILRRRDGLGSADVSVEMGCVRVRPLDPVAHACLPGSAARPWPAWFVDVGNPHAVVLAPSLEGVEIAAVGPTLENMRPGGQNVEIVTCEPGSGELVARRLGARRRGHARLRERQRARPPRRSMRPGSQPTAS